MIYIISILSLSVVVLGFTTFNLLRKVERYEDELNNEDKTLLSLTRNISMV
jgi:hypothetical protein